MKKKFLLLMVFAVLTFSACTDTTQTVDANNVKVMETPTETATPANTETKEITGNECRICDFNYANYKGDLNKEEIEGLLVALNDEYHALAVYGKVNEKFGSPRPFVNIERAESQHAERLKQVFKDYKVTVPENVWLGNAPEFKSVIEACRAGVEGELVNRDLYKKLFETTKREDILMVYRALQRVSEENHLPAFERCGGGNRRGRGNF